MMSKVALCLALVATALVVSAPGADAQRGTGKGKKPARGDLVQVRAASKIGVLLDEIMDLDKKSYDMALAFFTNESMVNDAFWVDRVQTQASYSNFRMAFRSAFYEGKKQLYLPLYKDITFSTPAHLEVIDGHHLVVRDYMLETYMVGKKDTAKLSDDALGTIGGMVVETYTFPIDPELVVQRTGYACMDEDQFPYGSVDAEAAAIYFDDSCTKGEGVPYVSTCTAALNGCHCTKGSEYDCTEAIEKFVGATVVSFNYTRVAWNEKIANMHESKNQYRVNPKLSGSDMIDYAPGPAHNGVVYQYFEKNSCEVNECLAGYGWRRVIKFDSMVMNQGPKAAHIGAIEYGAAEADSFNAANYHYLYHFDKCHGHPHFSSYAIFSVANMTKGKVGFCIQDVARIVNDRFTQFDGAYDTCKFQGVSTGWADTYNFGIPCQWVDITELDTTASEVKTNLDLEVNPLNFLCEGTQVKNKKGESIYVDTGMTTTSPPYNVSGEMIQKWKCDPTKGALLNNDLSTPVTIPMDGEGLLTSACPSLVGSRIGMKRDCEFDLVDADVSCQAGKKVTVACSLAKDVDEPYVVRICEASKLLKSGTACRYIDDFTLANKVVKPGKATEFQITCPKPKPNDPREPGGSFSYYAGVVMNGMPGIENNGAYVSCRVKKSG